MTIHIKSLGRKVAFDEGFALKAFLQPLEMRTDVNRICCGCVQRLERICQVVEVPSKLFTYGFEERMRPGEAAVYHHRLEEQQTIVQGVAAQSDSI